ncbi:MAG: thiamine pyrophosphate-dependent enzyme [Nitrospirota bacterium]
MKHPVSSGLFLSGNEAVALGAYEAGVEVASSYPGTPATEILESLAHYEGVWARWATNEKVCLEVALGASLAGARALASMKHVGLNNAADPLFASAYTGVRGGLVIAVADDPGMHSSQNEQDSRNYALAAKLPMLEPSDPGEAREFTKLAFDLSERFDIPVLLRTTTRVSHVKGPVAKGSRKAGARRRGLRKDPEKLVLLPAYAAGRRADLGRRLKRLGSFAEGFVENAVEWKDSRVGFITSGVSYLHVKEAFPRASVLKLGMVHPLPERLIRVFAGKVETLYVVEELDPFLETQIKALGVDCLGKELIPPQGEIDQSVLRRALSSGGEKARRPSYRIPPREPAMCPGCSYRGVFHALSKLDVFVAGDIGCYTLGALEPLGAIDSVLCMGAALGMALGMEKALGARDGQKKLVAVIGDSTFIHSGVNGLVDMVHNGGASAVVILDNGVTAMTGLQPTPASGNGTGVLDFEALAKAVGIRHVFTVDPFDLQSTTEVIGREVLRPEPSVVVARGPCALLPAVRERESGAFFVEEADCDGCRKCAGLGCPAIVWKKGRGGGRAEIMKPLCTGCGLCSQVCPREAIAS